MSSTISGNYSAYSTSSITRPSASQMASDLFSKLDTKNQGYIEKSDLETALAQVSDSSSSSSSADELFSQLDSDSDGKVTQDEMTSGFEKLASELDSQFSQMRMNGFSSQDVAQGMPPPPPPQDSEEDSGFTQDELTAQLSEIGSTDSQRSSLISDIIANFSTADTDGDGKVTGSEAMAYEQSVNSTSSSSSTSSSTSTSGSTTTDSTSSTSTTTASNEAKLLQTIMQLMQTYGYGSQDTVQSSSLSSLLSVSA